MAQFTSSTWGKYIGRWFLYSAIFLWILGGLFLVIGLKVKEVRFGFILTFVLMVLFSIPFLLVGRRMGRGAASEDQIYASGLDGTATITGLTQTGLFVNNNPEVKLDLQVNIPGRAQYNTTHGEIVPLILLGQLAVGATIPVKADPADPNKLVVEWAAVGAPTVAQAAATGVPSATSSGGQETLSMISQALQGTATKVPAPYAQAAQGQFSIAQIRDYLRQSGLEGWATVDKLEDTGKTVGADHMYLMQITVHLDGRAPYQTVEAATMVPVSAVGKVALGTTVPVRVAPENQELVMIEWDKV